VFRPPLRSACGRQPPRQRVYTLASLLGTRPAWLPGFLVPRCRVVSWAGQTTAQLAAGPRSRSTSVAQPIVESERVTVGLDSHSQCIPNEVGCAHSGWWCRSGKEDVHSRSLRSGQEFVDSVPDAAVKKGMHIFFTLRSVLSVATKVCCVDLDGPGHAPL
jgi:hypothetical protein